MSCLLIKPWSGTFTKSNVPSMFWSHSWHRSMMSAHPGQAITWLQGRNMVPGGRWLQVTHNLGSAWALTTTWPFHSIVESLKVNLWKPKRWTTSKHRKRCCCSFVSKKFAKSLKREEEEKNFMQNLVYITDLQLLLFIKTVALDTLGHSCIYLWGTD